MRRLLTRQRHKNLLIEWTQSAHMQGGCNPTFFISNTKRSIFVYPYNGKGPFVAEFGLPYYLKMILL